MFIQYDLIKTTHFNPGTISFAILQSTVEVNVMDSILLVRNKRIQKIDARSDVSDFRRMLNVQRMALIVFGLV